MLPPPVVQRAKDLVAKDNTGESLFKWGLHCCGLSHAVVLERES